METLKAFSARIRKARALLNAGDREGADEVLADLEKILPPPERRHWEAANKNKTRITGVAAPSGLNQITR